MALEWYVVNDNMELEIIDQDLASETIAVEDLTLILPDFYLTCYVDWDGNPRIIRDVKGLEGDLA